MAKFVRLVKMNVYIKYEQFQALKDVDFESMQNDLKIFFSEKGNGKGCVAIVRVFPTLTSSNTIDVELTDFEEEVDFINETNATDGIVEIINNYMILQISHVVVKQTNDPIWIVGELD